MLSEYKQTLLFSYIIFLAGTFILSILVNSLFLKFSKTLGIRNKPDSIIRWSGENKPSFGGISFYIVFLFTLSAYPILFEHNLNFRNAQFTGFLLATTLAFLMGLFDDAYNTRVIIKLTTQVLCGLILIYSGTCITIFDSPAVNRLVTLFWVIGIMNSINLLDNMDGISTLVSIFVFITSILAATLFHQVFNPYYLITLGLIASLCSFLIFNWHPSKMFMGDTGSQFLGVILAVLGILYFWNPIPGEPLLNPFRQVILVLTVFALPIIDTTTVFIKRIIKGSSPFVGGKDHTTHHLSYLGLSDNQVAWVFIGLSSICSMTGICILQTKTWSVSYSIIFSAFFLLLFLALFYIANQNKKK